MFGRNKTILNSTLPTGNTESSETKEIKLKDGMDLGITDTAPKTITEDWQWIDGYKCTNLNMQGHDNFQYELNKQYDIENGQQIKVCRNGFHFCKEIVHLFVYNDFPNSRFFKCRALVDINSNVYKNYGVPHEVGMLYQWRSVTDVDYKLVAKSIALTEEIDIKDTFGDFQKYNGTYMSQLSYRTVSDTSFTQIKDIDTYLEVYKYKDISVVASNRFRKFLVENGFSETFSVVCPVSDLYDCNTLSNYINALQNENISKDMLVYLLIQRYNKLKGTK